VSPPSLRFAYQLVSEGTSADGSELVIEDVPVEVLCQACGAKTRIAAFPLRCGTCGRLDADVVAGEELLVQSIEVTEEREEAMRT
jgi:hydrogenase nickel incorporation protein HypA/HybF